MKNLNEIFSTNQEIPEMYKIEKPFIQSEYLINGELKTWKGEFKKVYSPIYVKNGEQLDNYIGECPVLTTKESMEALESASKAFDHGNGKWAKMKVEERIDCLKKFTLMMSKARDLIVKLLMWEIGKSLSDSQKEFDRTITYIYDTIEAVKDLDRASSRFTISQDIIAQIRRAPLGVTLCMGPFNYPLNETFTTLIPALIMGNTIIFKPPKLGMLLFQPLLRAFQQCFPAGVVNTIYGSGENVVTPIMQSEKTNVLAFIGTSRVANILKKEHPKPNRLKTVLGLDAKNPAIILDGADLDLTVKECAIGSLSFNGQRCTALKIIFVQEQIAQKFTEKLVDYVEKMEIGLPWDKNVAITPLPETNKAEYLQSLIDDAVAKGAKLENPNGGKHYESLFFPAILSNVNSSMRVYHEEQFGPIIPIVTYESICEPLVYVIESNHGQQASLFGNNSDEIANLVDVLVNQVCRVNINSQCQRGPDDFPFTGRKDSAEQTLSVSDALRVFSIRTLVAAKETEENKMIIRDIVKEDKSNFLNTDFIL
ncbi:MAG: NADP-dependent glyceraldehyde-3-phosphate dehydrogenase [Bacteroidales bacterium]|jgi:glyceraldehyde-3-phosphate dehydrogenase (NADP+)|nr:NADP-dependent glyceraldehyde-3-phosphate dehydrogenase [Bacteroidales bacterium]